MHASTLRLWAVVTLSGLSHSLFGQGPNLSQALPAQQVVTEGRNAMISAPMLSGSIQWQFAGGGKSWTDITDDSTYQGASTKTLEISGVTKALENFLYRFVNTNNGVTVASNVSRLVVSPLLLPMVSGISLDASGGLYVTDASNHTVRYISNALWYGWGNLTDMTGKPLFCQVSLVGGQNGRAGAVDGATGVALFNQPGGIALEINRSVRSIFVSDTANGTIRRIGPGAGAITTWAGSSTLRGNVDGAGSAALFSAPVGVARAADGSLFVADSTNHTIRKITADGIVRTFAGSPGNAGTADGTGPAARFNTPTGIAINAQGFVFVADTVNNTIRRITPAGEVTTLAGLAGVAGSSDGIGNQATFNGPTGLAAAYSGVYVADTGNSTIRSVTFDGTVSTYAGLAGVAGLKDALYDPAGYFPALFNQPRALAWDTSGLLFIADTGNAAIRVISYYDGQTLTLPLTEESIAYRFPTDVFFPSPTLTPTPTTTVSTPPPASTAPASSSSGGGSGGGAIDAWFVLALGGGWLLRKLSRHVN
jgi:hypothetical protein